MAATDRNKSYTPSAAVRNITQSAPPPAQAAVRYVEPVYEQRPQQSYQQYVQPRQAPQQQSIRQNPVVQELLSRAVQYYSQPAPSRLAGTTQNPYGGGGVAQPQPLNRQANIAQQRNLMPGAYDVGAQQALSDIDNIQFEIARAQESQGKQTSMGYFPDDTGNAGNLLQLRALQDQTIAAEQSRLHTQRASEEARAVGAFPKLTPEYLSGLTDQQLDSLLALAPTDAPKREKGGPSDVVQLPFGAKPTGTGPKSYDGMDGFQRTPATGKPVPVIGSMADGVRPTTRELQAADVGIEIAKVDAQINHVNQTVDSRGYATDADRAAIVALQIQKEQLLEHHGALTNYNPQSIAGGIGNILDTPGPGGSPLDVASEVAGYAKSAWGAVPDPAKEVLGDAYEEFKSIAVPITDKAKWTAMMMGNLAAENMAKIEYLEKNYPEVRQTLESFTTDKKKPWREIFAEVMNALDKPRQENVGTVGDALYLNATGTAPWQKDNPDDHLPSFLNWTQASPVDMAYLIVTNQVGKDVVDAAIKDAHDNGYSSPNYIAQMEANGVTDYPPEFTGGRAVWEAMVGQMDNLSTGQRMVVLGILDTVFDPFTYLAPWAKAGEGLSLAGRALREGSDNILIKGAGLLTEGAGIGIKTAAELPDAPFIAAGAVGGAALRQTGNIGGILSESNVSLARGAAGDLNDYQRSLARGEQTYAEMLANGTAAPANATAPTAATAAPPPTTAAAATPAVTTLPSGNQTTVHTNGNVYVSNPASVRTSAMGYTVKHQPGGGFGVFAPGSTTPAATAATQGEAIDIADDILSGLQPSTVTTATTVHGTTVTTGAPPPPPAPTRAGTPTEAAPTVTTETPTRTTAPIGGERTTTPSRTAAATEANADYPALAASETRATDTAERRPGWRGLDGTRTPPESRDTPLAASTGGDQGFLDDLATDAAALPNTAENIPVKTQANDFLQAVEDGPQVQVRSDPWYQNFNEGGTPVHTPADAITPDVMDAYNRMNPDTFIGNSNAPGGAQALTAARADPTVRRVYDVAVRSDLAAIPINSYGKSVLTNTAIMQGKVDAAALYRTIYQDAPSGTILPEPPRSPTRNFRDESAEWLAWRYVTDGDENALRVLESPGPMFTTANGDLVVRKFPPTGVANELDVRLAGMRDRYVFATHPGTAPIPESVARRVYDALFNPRIGLVAQGTMMPGISLGGRGQKFGDWFKHLNELSTRSVDDTAIHVQDDWLRVLYSATAIDDKTAEYGSRIINYSPDVKYSGIAPGSANQFTVQEALEFVAWREEADAQKIKNMTPSKAEAYIKSGAAFNGKAERTKIGLLAADLPLNTRPSSKAGAAASRGLRIYDKGMSYYRNAKLAGPVMGIGGAINDIIGNSFIKVISGNATPRDIMNISPWRIATQTKVYRDLGRDELAFAITRQSQYLTDAGLQIPSQLIPGFRGMEDVAGGLPPINAAFANKPFAVRAAANALSVPSLLDARMTSEVMGRMTIYDNIAKSELEASLSHGIRGADTSTGGAFFTYLEGKHPGQAADLIDQIRAEANTRAGKMWDGGISPADVKKVVDEDAARAWQREMNAASDKGLLESNRVYFSGKTTNADEIARRAFTFHYWQSRASMFHLRTATRNPFLLNAYWKLWQDIQDRSEGLPAYMNSMIKVFTSGAGISAAVNPFGYLFPTTVLDATDEHGNRFSALFHLLAPMLQGALAVGGADQSPQFDPFRGTERLLTALINQSRTDGTDVTQIPIIGKYLGGLEGDTLVNGHISEDVINAIVGEVNDAAKAMLGKFGIAVGDFEPFDRGGYDYDLGVSAVQQVMEGIYGPRETWGGGDPEKAAVIIKTYEDAVDAYFGGSEGNAIAQEAQSIETQRQLTSAGLNAIAPGSTSWNDWRYQTSQDAAAGYTALTNGQELTPAQQGAIDNRQDAKGANILWNTMSDAYHDLGTPESQQLWSTAQKIINNDPSIVGQSFLAYKPDGSKVYVSGTQLARMTDEERKDWVDQWLYTWPDGKTQFDAYDTARKDFLAANPEYQAYKTYQGAVGDNPREFRTELAETNPNFARAMEAQQEYLESQGITGEKLQQELDSWAFKEPAYFAAIGEPYKQTDPKPIDVYNPGADVTNNPGWPTQDSGGGGGSSGGGKKDITQMQSIGHGFYQDTDGKTYNKDGVFVGKQNELDTHDKQWAALNKMLEQLPEYRTSERAIVINAIANIDKPELLAKFEQDQLEWQTTNQNNEQLYGDNWNDQTGTWESWADSEKERTALNLPQWIPFPGNSDMFKTYQWWVATYGDTDVNAFIDYYYKNKVHPEYYQ